MALRDKLEGLTQKIKVEEQKKENQKKNEELKPLRAVIKKLEKEKLDLEIIKNSLDFKKKSTNDGLGMKEYADLTAKETKAAKKELEELSQENEAALESIGVETIDDLVSRPEFSEDEEVVTYKKAKEQEEGLNFSDAKLKSRLESLGIKMEDESFSYEAASDEIGQRLETLEAELIENKLKTPEGCKEVIDNLSQEFSREIKDLVWGGSSFFGQNLENKKTPYCALKIEERFCNNNFTVEFLDDGKAKVNGIQSLHFLPDNFANKVNKYGLEVATAALKDSYKQKLEAVFMDSNGPSGMYQRFQTALEKVNPDKYQKAAEFFQSFIEKKKELFSLLQSKTKELKERSIEFNPVKACHYGLEYSEIFKFCQGNFGYVDEEYLLEEIRAKNAKLFPRYDADLLISASKKRQDEIEEAIEVIKNINTQKDVDEFDVAGRFYDPGTFSKNIHYFSKQVQDNKLDNLELKMPNELISYREREFLSSKRGNFDEALQYVNHNLVVSEEFKSRMAEKLEEVVELNVIEDFVLKNKLGAGRRLTSLDGLKDYIESVEREKRNALILVSELADLKNKLAAETEISISSGTVKSLEKTRNYERLHKELDEKEKEISDKESELRMKRNKKPGLFKKEKWQTEISSLEEGLEKAKQEKITLKSDYDKNVKEAYNYIDTKKLSWFSETEKMLEKYRATGKAGEVFKELEDKLLLVANNEAPDDIKHYYDKLSDLYKKIRGEK